MGPSFSPAPTRRGGHRPPRPPRAFSARRFSTRHPVAVRARVSVSELGVSQRTFGGDSSGCARSGRQSVPAGPGLSRFRCVWRRTGHGHGAGSGRVQSPDTGRTRERACERSARNRIRPAPGRLHLHRPLRRRSLNAVAPTDGGSDVAACAVRDGLLAARAIALVPSGLRAAAATGGSPCSPSVAPGPGVPRDRLRCRPGVRSNSVATGIAAAGMPSAAGVPREAFPLRLATDGTGSRGSGPERVRRGSPSAPSLWPYARPFTTVYPPAVPSRRRGASVASMTDGACGDDPR